MTKFKIPGRDCIGCNDNFGDELEFQDEGVSLGTASVVDFVGEAVEATKSGNKVTVTVSGGQSGGSDFFRGGFTMTTAYPTAATISSTGKTGGSGTAGAIKAGDVWPLTIGGTGEVIIDGKQYLDGQLLQAGIDSPGQTTANWIRILT